MFLDEIASILKGKANDHEGMMATGFWGPILHYSKCVWSLCLSLNKIPDNKAKIDIFARSVSLVGCYTVSVDHDGKKMGIRN